MILIGKADEVCSGLLEKAMEKYKVIENLRLSASRLFGTCVIASVHYSVNYMADSEMTFDIDCLAYQTFQYLLTLCQEF